MSPPRERPSTMSAVELLERRFPAPRWAIPQILPEGASLLVGGPKLGKSWMVLGWAVAIASGGRALGSIAVEPGEVLYLALEDTPRRLQSRLATILDDPHAVPAGLHLATRWPRIDEGGLDELDAWLNEHPDCRLVAIDTLARLRAPRRRGEDLYAADYGTLAAVKTVADRHRVAIVLVHHDRKLKADDPFDAVSGTQGLAAAADATLIVKRTRGAADAVLHLTGRDVEEAQHALTWAPAAGTWTIRELEVPDASEERATILDALRHLGTATPSKLADWTGRPVGSVKRLAWTMARDGQLAGGGRGGYSLPSSTEPTEPRESVEPGEPSEPSEPKRVQGSLGSHSSMANGSDPKDADALPSLPGGSARQAASGAIGRGYRITDAPEPGEAPDA